MANPSTIILLLFSSAVVSANILTQCELGWLKNSTGSDPTPPADLIAWYQFNTNGLDSHTNHYDLDSNGSPAFTSGKTGGGLICDATSFYSLTNYNDFALAGDRTFTFWVKYNSFASIDLDGVFFGKTDAIPQDLEYTFSRLSDDTVYFNVRDIGDGLNAIGSIIPDTNQWAFVVAYYHSASTTIGLSVNLEPAITSFIPNGGPRFSTFYSNYFGSSPINGTTVMNGLILDDMLLWRRLLTAEETTNLFNGTWVYGPP